jgi:elongation factor Ts
MHITASRPKYLKKDDITEAEVSKAKEVFAAEMVGKSTPEAMQEKILEGKLAAYFADQVLLNQAFIKNPELTIQALIDNAVQKFGEKIEISRFVRLGVAE